MERHTTMLNQVAHIAWVLYVEPDPDNSWNVLQLMPRGMNYSASQELCPRMVMCCVLQLTHWGRVTHICVGNITTIGSDNGLSPGRRQAIIWNNAELSCHGVLEHKTGDSSTLYCRNGRSAYSCEFNIYSVTMQNVNTLFMYKPRLVLLPANTANHLHIGRNVICHMVARIKYKLHGYPRSWGHVLCFLAIQVQTVGQNTGWNAHLRKPYYRY